MPGPLSKYRQKRDPARTNEPEGDELAAASGTEDHRGTTWRGAFVMHQHAATRMHFDLRLEVSGVLASFAIPHGPTLDPTQKHLAVHTEDHPIEYLDFEAVIPAGNYGAGAMIAWDVGTVRFLDMCAEDGLRAGKLHFALEGKKLRGRYGLVRLSPKEKRGRPDTIKEWLFIKKADAAATGRDLITEQPRSVFSGLRVEELPRAAELAKEIEARAAAWGARPPRVDGHTISPMLCTLADVPAGPGWLHELKLDGVRVIASKDERGVELRYRSGRSATTAYPEVVRAISALSASALVLDGEVVAYDESGRPSFERLARRIHHSPRTDLSRALSEVPVEYAVFDLLSIGQHSVVDLPLHQRKELLRSLLPGNGILRALDHLEGGGDKLFAFARQNGIEGIVSKQRDGTYQPGPQRYGAWIKTKCEQEASFVVVGYCHGKNSRKRLGSLDLASFEDGQLWVRGEVGSGLDEATIDRLLALLDPHTRAQPSAKGEYDSAPRGRVHVEPAVVVRVRYLEWSEGGSLRFPVFLRIEPEADPRECVAGPHDEEHATGGGGQEEAHTEPKVEVRISNRSKVFWPNEGYTKGDLVDYYAEIAPVLLPYLDGRPVMLVRYPDGIEGKSFYQWNVPHGMPAWVRSVVLGRHVQSAEEGDQKKHVFLIDRVESLLYIANLACIPVHILASRVASPNDCDFLTIDFDINKSSLLVAVELAHSLRGILTRVGLTGFPKTSGQTGLHVFVPLGPGVTPQAAKTLAELLGRLLVERHPDAATMERVVERRGTKVYVDTGQTGPSRTIVAPYSVRATQGARVSTPLSWEEVVADLDPASFTIKTVPARVRASGDPMASLLSERPDMAAVMNALARELAPDRKA